MIRAVVFDFGDTLVQFYSREQFPQILREAMDECRTLLVRNGKPCPPADEVMRRARLENFEAEDHSVRPLEQRLARIFDLADLSEGALMDDMCSAFLTPIAKIGRCYDDAETCLRDIKAMGLRTAILTNNPWGAPSKAWKTLIMSHKFASMVDAVLCCRDVGWRKPSRRSFERVIAELQVNPDEAVMVGDSFAWDVRGATSAGLKAVHLDRGISASTPDMLQDGEYRMASLKELAGYLDSLRGPATQMRLSLNIPLDTQTVADMISDPEDLHLVWPLAKHPFDHDQWKEALDPERGVKPFLLYDGDTRVGHAALSPDGDEGKYAVRFMYVSPALRSKGTGGKLMGLLEAYARTELNAKLLTLVVRTYNPRARRCYEKAGFQEVSREDTLIRMAKRLS